MRDNVIINNTDQMSSHQSKQVQLVLPSRATQPEFRHHGHGEGVQRGIAQSTRHPGHPSSAIAVAIHSQSLHNSSVASSSHTGGHHHSTASHRAKMHFENTKPKQISAPINTDSDDGVEDEPIADQTGVESQGDMPAFNRFHAIAQLAQHQSNTSRVTQSQQESPLESQQRDLDSFLEKPDLRMMAAPHSESQTEQEGSPTHPHLDNSHHIKLAIGPDNTQSEDQTMLDLRQQHNSSKHSTHLSDSQYTKSQSISLKTNGGRDSLLMKSSEKSQFIGDEYCLLKDLGEGTFGNVKLGRHLPSNQLVAVKILEKRRITDAADRERVAREMSILKSIRHAHIIKLYEIIETTTRVFLIMEYACGGELFDYIVRKDRLSEREACRFYNQIISGIEFLHSKGIAHRDLKPENLLLDKKKNLKFVDFGLSNTYKTGQTLKTACGSPCYAAPEMIAGKRYSGLEVDIWSSGVTLYAMLCGFLPFEDPDTALLYKKILKGDFELPDFLSNRSIKFLKQVLCTDPKKRITLEQIKEHAWFTQLIEPQPGCTLDKKRNPLMLSDAAEMLAPSPEVINQNLYNTQVFGMGNTSSILAEPMKVENVTTVKHQHPFTTAILSTHNQPIHASSSITNSTKNDLNKTVSSRVQDKNGGDSVTPAASHRPVTTKVRKSHQPSGATAKLPSSSAQSSSTKQRPSTGLKKTAPLTVHKNQSNIKRKQNQLIQQQQLPYSSAYLSSNGVSPRVSSTTLQYGSTKVSTRKDGDSRKLKRDQPTYTQKVNQSGKAGVKLMIDLGAPSTGGSTDVPPPKTASTTVPASATLQQAQLSQRHGPKEDVPESVSSATVAIKSTPKKKITLHSTSTAVGGTTQSVLRPRLTAPSKQLSSVTQTRSATKAQHTSLSFKASRAITAHSASRTVENLAHTKTAKLGLESLISKIQQTTKQPVQSNHPYTVMAVNQQRDRESHQATSASLKQSSKKLPVERTSTSENQRLSMSNKKFVKSHQTLQTALTNKLTGMTTNYQTQAGRTTSKSASSDNKHLFSASQSQRLATANLSNRQLKKAQSPQRVGSTTTKDRQTKVSQPQLKATLAGKKAQKTMVSQDLDSLLTGAEQSKHSRLVQSLETLSARELRNSSYLQPQMRTYKAGVLPVDWITDQLPSSILRTLETCLPLLGIDKLVRKSEYFFDVKLHPYQVGQLQVGSLRCEVELMALGETGGTSMGLTVLRVALRGNKDTSMSEDMQDARLQRYTAFSQQLRKHLFNEQ